MQETAVNIVCNTAMSAEERRIHWTSYQILKSWFDNWQSDLLELGFAYETGDDVKISDEQLARIGNIDETCLSLDGSSGLCGGHPEVTFYNKWF